MNCVWHALYGMITYTFYSGIQHISIYIYVLDTLLVAGDTKKWDLILKVL